MKSLKGLLTAARIRSLATSLTIKRGQDYYARGNVQSLTRTFTGVRAFILGQRTYKVELSVVGKTLEYDCTCPLGQQGDFCKHCVATAIAFLNDPPPENAFPVESIRAQLQAETPARLAELVLEWAADNEYLQDRLLQYQADLAGPDAAVLSLRPVLQRALRRPPRHTPDDLPE